MWRFIFFSFLFWVSAVPAGENWPQFRGPNGDGHSSARSLAKSWAENTPNIRWKTAIPHKGWSSPVIWKDQIWLTTAKETYAEDAPKENTQKLIPRPEVIDLFAICLDRSTGKITHEILLHSERNPKYCHSFNSYATPTPVIEEGHVYLHFGSHGTFAVDTSSGKIVWSRLDLVCDHWRGPGSSPVIFQNALILTFDGHDRQYLEALDKRTGKTLWHKEKEITYRTNDGDYKKAFSTPGLFTINGKTQLVSPSAEVTLAVDPINGEELWRVHHGGMNAAARPLHAHGLIFLTSGHKASVLAVRDNHQGTIPQDKIAWVQIKGAPSRPSLTLVGEHLFYVSDNGFVTCTEAKTGQVIWNERLGGAFSASPIVAAGVLYFFDQDGVVSLVEAKPEYKLLGKNKLDNGCMASPAVKDDVLYIRTKTHMYAIGKEE